MGLPVIMVVEGNRGAVTSVEAQLRERYGASYRIECPVDADAAGALLDQLAGSGDHVALCLVGNSVYERNGADVFDRARRTHPQAKRALLVPPNVWVDPGQADLIRAAMALGRIDHFLLEPGPPPDEVFHEAVSNFLLEWARERRLVPDTVTIVGEDWSGRAYEIRSVLESCAVSHDFCLADSERGRELLAKAGPDARLPLMVLPDGSTISDPTNAEMATVAGAPEAIGTTTYDLLVVGSGPAGLSAAVYGASEGLRVLVVDSGGIGGQARSSSLIRNYLGFSRGVSGGRLAQQAYEQASLFGAEFLFFHRASELVLEDGLMRLRIADGPAVSARAVILATGASYRRLGIPSLEALIGAGVFYGGPVSEAPTLAGKDVFVVGGGNSAGQAALHLARYARQVTLVVRASSLGAAMSQYLVRAVEATPGIVVRTETAVCGGDGDGRLERLVLCDAAGGGQTLPADALFVLIGARPLTDWLPPAIARDRHGFLLTGEDVREGWPLARRPFAQETSVPRVFAAGDARHGSIKRVAAAVGEGASVVQAVHQVLDELEPPADRVA
ncbi:MAG TPA: FAD-dependent oxidoreductase [Gaiellales bacterium]|jgi:thioredoxin reductase (NADPH)|nr:FAD-dependent oxidoreductase [Gaiellales bacterium]